MCTFRGPLGVAHTGPMQPRQALITLQPQAGVLLCSRGVCCHPTQAVNSLLTAPLLPHFLRLHTPLAHLHTHSQEAARTMCQCQHLGCEADTVEAMHSDLRFALKRCAAIEFKPHHWCILYMITIQYMLLPSGGRVPEQSFQQSSCTNGVI